MTKLIEKDEVLRCAIGVKFIPKKLHYIYFLIKHAEIVYIGRTSCFETRMYQHSLTGKNYTKVSFLYMTKTKAIAMEKELIRKFTPKYNKLIPPVKRRIKC